MRCESSLESGSVSSEDHISDSEAESPQCLSAGSSSDESVAAVTSEFRGIGELSPLARNDEDTTAVLPLSVVVGSASRTKGGSDSNFGTFDKRTGPLSLREERSLHQLLDEQKAARAAEAAEAAKAGMASSQGSVPISRERENGASAESSRREGESSDHTGGGGKKTTGKKKGGKKTSKKEGEGRKGRPRQSGCCVSGVRCSRR